VQGLADNKGTEFADAIITSDTRHKIVAIEFEIGGKPVRIGASCKGAGMISPCMATMLCFITTDAGISRANLDKCTHDAVESTFNRITIDGDMSTNDTVLVLANGASGATVETAEDIATFKAALTAVMHELAKMVVKDGERVTKFVTVNVSGARNFTEAKLVAETVCKSFLVKSSWNGNDPNWGRIIHAVGYSRAKVREELIDIDIAGLPACRGGLQTDTPSDNLREAVSVPEFAIDINLNQGEASYTVYTSDISPEYVDFNRSEYAYWNQAKVDGLTK
jgi:glutamate N-acetyltransferase/amino-acid N-acetyltransferase